MSGATTTTDRSNLTSFGANLFGYGTTEYKDPRTETFMDMLRLNLCPQLTFYSFAVIFSFVILGFFGAQLAIDGIDRGDKDMRIQTELLPIKAEGFLTGALKNQLDKVRDSYQLYRPLTSLLVHTNFIHLLTNIITLVIWTSLFEFFLTTYKVPIIFALSG